MLRGSTRPPLPRAGRSTRGRNREAEELRDKEMEELRDDVRRAYVIADGLQRDVTQLQQLFKKGPR